MNKVILVMDMPKNCSSCSYSSGVYGAHCVLNGRPLKNYLKENCPLQRLPDKMDNYDGKRLKETESEFEDGIKKGWNDCIRKIELCGSRFEWMSFTSDEELHNK